MLLNSSVIKFTKYIKKSVTDDYDINFVFKNRHIVNLHCLVSSIEPKCSIEKFVYSIFRSSIINKIHYDAIIIIFINILNKIKYKGVYFNKLTCHRLTFILLLLSCKVCDDCHYDNSSWSHITRLSLDEINKMEITILKLLNFNLSLIISDETISAIAKTVYHN